MKETLLMYARYTERANASALALLDAQSLEARNEDRKSYYGSLSGLAAHIVGCTLYFHGLFRASFPGDTALRATEGRKLSEGKTLTGDAWAALRELGRVADRATVDFVASLGEEELGRPVRLDWYGGKPDSVPLHFLAHQLYTHGTHHRGQVSQILDSMGVEHDFSGIDLAFLPE